MIRVSAVAPCTSEADDLAFASLADAVRVIADMPEARIVGGHMVGLLLTAFPVPGLTVRRTTDADAGLSTAIAAGGDVTARLLDLGCTRVDGSRFVREGRMIDLLVEVHNSTAHRHPAGVSTRLASCGRSRHETCASPMRTHGRSGSSRSSASSSPSSEGAST